MKRKTITLFVGIIHSNTNDDDFADIRFITLSEEEAKKELENVNDYAVKILRLKCIIKRENYILCKSIDETNFLESFYVERIVIIKGDNIE